MVFDRVTRRREHDRDDRCRLLGSHHWQCSGGENDVDLEADELGRNLGEALLASLAPAILDSDSAAVDPAKLAQPLRKRGDPFAARGTRALPQEADGRQLACLLRARREWPCDGGADNCFDEIASSHCLHQGRDYAE